MLVGTASLMVAAGVGLGALGNRTSVLVLPVLKLTCTTVFMPPSATYKLSGCEGSRARPYGWEFLYSVTESWTAQRNWDSNSTVALSPAPLSSVTSAPSSSVKWSCNLRVNPAAKRSISPLNVTFRIVANRGEEIPAGLGTCVPALVPLTQPSPSAVAM